MAMTVRSGDMAPGRHRNLTSVPTASSGAASATTPSPWSHGRSPAPAGRARGSSASGGGSSWTLPQARERAMARADHARAGLTVRCAIYTRKSSDKGLEQEFNSLDAQREACEAYIVSQRHAGWIALSDMYDDGGLGSGPPCLSAHGEVGVGSNALDHRGESVRALRRQVLGQPETPEHVLCIDLENLVRASARVDRLALDGLMSFSTKRMAMRPRTIWASLSPLKLRRGAALAAPSTSVASQT